MDNQQLFDSILERAWSLHASDVHLTTGSRPAFRLHKSLESFEDTPMLTHEIITGITESVLTPEELETLKRRGDVDTTFRDGQENRFRLNVHRERRGIAIAIRRLPRTSPLPEEIGLPEKFAKLADEPHGLILIVGPTGSGKTTTRAALIRHINRTQKKHIIILEDSTEHTFENENSFIEHRIVGPGKNVHSYAEAISSAMRQDPDVIFLGDLRDRSTMEAALSAAQTGHLVVAEVHAGSTYQALHRIIASFPDISSSVREQLADQFLGAIAQRIHPRKDGSGQIAAFEVLIGNHAVKSKIRHGTIETIRDEIQISRDQGMFTLEAYTEELARQGIIDSP